MPRLPPLPPVTRLAPGSLNGLRIKGLIPEDVVRLLVERGMNLKEIGAAFNVSRERARQIASRANGGTGSGLRLARQMRDSRLAVEAVRALVPRATALIEEHGFTIAPRMVPGRGFWGQIAIGTVEGPVFRVHHARRGGCYRDHYYRFSLHRVRDDGVTHHLCFTPDGRVYVVPHDVIPPGFKGVRYIRVDGQKMRPATRRGYGRRSGLDDYLDAWPTAETSQVVSL